MIGWLGKIAGPRVMLGVIVAGLAAVTILGWLAWSAREDAAQASAKNAQLRQTVSEQSKDHQRLRAELDRRDEAVAAAQREAQQIRAEADEARTQLQEAFSDDTCANTRHPAAVTRSLRFGAGGQDRD